MLIQANMAANNILPQRLAEAMENSREEILLIDCRPFIAFNQGHINTSQNVHCPTIIKRRSAGILSLENIVRCPQSRCKMLTGGFDIIVIYDEKTNDISELSKDSNMLLVLRTLKEKGIKMVYLKGGYETFAKYNPRLCTSTPALSTVPQTLGYTTTHSSTITAPTHCSYASQTQELSMPSPRVHLRLTKQPSHNDNIDEQNGPVEILPWLYIGAKYHAIQRKQLESLGITSVLNVSSTDIVPPPEGVAYKIMPIDDNCMSDIISWFPDAIKFIETVRQQNGRVLVHCLKGISRSATICIAYLMYNKHMTLEQAYDYLKSKRSIIEPNLNFMRQLLEYEAEIVEHKDLTLRAKASMTLCVTPTSCTQQAAVPVFAFDVPLGSPLGSPTTKPLHLCHSPLISPS